MARIAAAAVLALALAAIASAAAKPNPARPLVFASTRSLNPYPGHDIIVVDRRGLRTNVTATPLIDEVDPAWAPDGLRLAVSTTTYPQDLYVINTRTHVKTRLTTALGEEREAAWSPDGARIAFMRRFARSSVFNLVVRDLGSGDEHVLATGSPEYSAGSPVWSPDGREIAFRDWNGIYVVDTDAGGQRRLVDPLPGLLPELVAWLPEGVVIWNTSYNDYGIVIVSPNGSRRAVQNPCGMDEPNWSLDGTEVACPLASQPPTPTKGIWVQPLRIAFRNPQGLMLRTVELQPPNHDVVISGGTLRAGRYAYAATTRARDADLWLVGADGRNPSGLTSGPGDDHDPSWSDGGREVVFVRSWPGGQREDGLFTVDTRTHRVRSLGVTGSNPDWERGGRRIVYTASSGGVVVRNLRTGHSHLVARDGLFAAWRPRSHTLAMVNKDTIVYSIGADGRGRRALFNADTDQDIEDIAWSPDGQAIAFVTKYEVGVWRGGRGIRVLARDKHNPFSSVTWSRDGASIVYSTGGTEEQPSDPDEYWWDAHAPQLWSVRAAGGKPPTIFTPGVGSDFDPAWRQ